MKSSLASRANDAELAAFCCCEADAPGWQREVDDYVRAFALRRSEHVLALRTDGDELVGISAFDTRTIDWVPMNEPTAIRGWHLNALAIRLTDQRSGLSAELFTRTFEAMRRIDPSRSLVTASAHPENGASIKACASAGIECLDADADGYLRLIGAVPGTSPPFQL